MPESATPVQQPQTIIEIWPFKGGWQCFETSVVGEKISQLPPLGFGGLTLCVQNEVAAASKASCES
jgi:hypothetical protein